VPQGEEILDRVSKLTMPLAEDYEQSKRDTWSSKSMLQFIKSRKSAVVQGEHSLAVARLAYLQDIGLPESE